MSGINKVTLVGRLTKDVEVRKTNSGLSVAQVTIACDRIKKDDPADFITVVVWRQAADFLGQYAKKGTLIAVDGRMKSRSYEKDGQKVYVTEVEAENVSIVNGSGSGSMNHVTLLGRLTKDVEARKTGNDTSVAQFSVACDGRRKDDPADFLNCVAWRQAADFLAQYAKKGDTVGVDGSIRTRNYEKDGQKVYVTEILADKVVLYSKSRDQQDASGSKDDDDKDEVVVPEIEISSDDLPF